MDINAVNMIDVQNRAKSLGLKLNLSGNIFESFDLDAMDTVQRWVWTGEGPHPKDPAPAPSANKSSLLADLLDLQGLLNDFDTALRAA